MDDARRPVDLDRRPVGLHGGELAAGDGSTKWRGTPMDDALRPVDLDRRPVGLHGGDLAAGDAPQQTGAVQVVQRARWMISKTGPEHPNSTPGAVVWFAVAALHGSGMVFGIGDRGRYLRRVVGRGGPGRRRQRPGTIAHHDRSLPLRSPAGDRGGPLS